MTIPNTTCSLQDNDTSELQLKPQHVT